MAWVHSWDVDILFYVVLIWYHTMQVDVLCQFNKNAKNQCYLLFFKSSQIFGGFKPKLVFW